MKPAYAALLAILPATAWAHPGHIGPFGGHNHWGTGVLLATVLVVAAIVARALTRP